MNTKHKKTLDKIFKKPTSSDVRCNDIEMLFIHLGSDLSEGQSSRVRVAYNGVRAILHRPHPHHEVSKEALHSIRRFLINAGIPYDEI